MDLCGALVCLLLSLAQLVLFQLPFPHFHGRKRCDRTTAQSRSRCVFCTPTLSLYTNIYHPENNLFLVKRLIQRTDMRNTDVAPRKYTSLAWAAVLGHEETFEYLLSVEHDDHELSKVCLRVTPLLHAYNTGGSRITKTTRYSCY